MNNITSQNDDKLTSLLNEIWNQNNPLFIIKNVDERFEKQLTLYLE